MRHKPHNSYLVAADLFSPAFFPLSLQMDRSVILETAWPHQSDYPEWLLWAEKKSPVLPMKSNASTA